MDTTFVSSILISTLFKEEKKDVLELLKVFVINVLPRRNEETIDADEVTKKLKDQFHFIDLPSQVTEKVLKRLSKKNGILERVDNKYKLTETVKVKEKPKKTRVYLNELREEFKESKETIKKNTEDVLQSLGSYLEKDDLKNREKIQEYLFDFFEELGFKTLYQPGKIKETKIKNKHIYKVASFVTEHYEKETSIFDSICEMFQGYMIRNILYVQNYDIDYKSSFKSLHCYLDTGILLRMLELKTEKENEAMNQLKTSLKSFGVTLKTFTHNVQEVEGILENYERRIGLPQYQTLEKFNEMEVDEFYVRNYINELESILESKEIIIEETPDYKSENQIDYSEEKLTTFLDSRVRYTTQKQLNNDVKSITAIRRFRTDVPKKDLKCIEKSNSLFITNNLALAEATRQFFNREDQVFTVPPVYSDLDIASILWMKSPNDLGDLPQLSLLQNAYASLSPKPAFIEALKEKIDKLKEYDRFSGEVLERTLHDSYSGKELMELTGGDIDNIDEFLIDKEHEKYLQYKLGEKDKLEQENERQKKESEEYKSMLKKIKERELKNKEEKVDRHSKLMSVFFVAIVTFVVIISFYFIAGIFMTHSLAVSIIIIPTSILVEELAHRFFGDILYRRLYRYFKNALEHYLNNRELKRLERDHPELF